MCAVYNLTKVFLSANVLDGSQCKCAEEAGRSDTGATREGPDCLFAIANEVVILETFEIISITICCVEPFHPL